jgi:hypothetical protein
MGLTRQSRGNYEKVLRMLGKDASAANYWTNAAAQETVLSGGVSSKLLNVRWPREMQGLLTGANKSECDL